MINIKKQKIEKFVKKNKTIPMGDDTIRKYFPKAKIIKYSDLKNLHSIEQILPKHKSFCFLLYQDSPQTGHWVCINRIGGKLEFFDSYGGAPDTQLEWTSPEIRADLGIDRPYLSDLFKSSGYTVAYNSIKYQTDGSDVNTCGRHGVFRILSMLEHDTDLDQYYEDMLKTKNKLKIPYDKIVSLFIQK